LYDASVYRDFNGQVLGVLPVARDASKRRKQERLSLQQQAALKSRVVLEQAKGITAPVGGGSPSGSAGARDPCEGWRWLSAADRNTVRDPPGDEQDQHLQQREPHEW
jgi:hypothetical protein